MDSMEVSRHSPEGAGSLVRTSSVAKFNRKGRCEVVSIAGAAGVGKSCLVQSIQKEARGRGWLSTKMEHLGASLIPIGYFASSKFDQARKKPFGPVLKLLSSLFRQVFSERNLDTPFHTALKAFVRPVWPMLSDTLDLPRFLLAESSNTQKLPKKQPSQKKNSADAKDSHRRDSSPSISPSGGPLNSLSSSSSRDFLRAGSATKSTRLMNVYTDVLRLFALHKFIW
jgi:hypothetical protein